MTTTTIITPRPETRTDTVLRSRTDDVHAVPAALRSEWIKVSTLRTNKVILGLTAGVGATIAAALAATATDGAVSASELFIYPLPLVATLAIVTGILMFTAVMVLLGSLIADVLYGIADPRIGAGGR